MGEHSAPEPAWLVRVIALVQWVVANKGKILTTVIAVMPLVSRYVPWFPSEEVLSVVRLFLGA